MSEVGKNATNAAGNAVKSANQTMNEMGKNASNAMGAPSNAVNQLPPN